LSILLTILHRFKFEYPSDNPAFIDTIFLINLINEKNDYNSVMENLDKNLEFQIKNSLLTVLQKVDEVEIASVKDNYNIRHVYLKDSSLFRYAPRRM